MTNENKKAKLDRLSLLATFNAVTDDTWFDQTMVAAVRDCSLATIERDRWAGTGVPFVKSGRSVRYRKIDIQNWLSKHKPVQSTTQYQQQREANHDAS
jgi:hypothetical protein